MKLKILLVDDSDTLLKLMTALFEELGHTVVGKAKNGTEAIELYSKCSPDLVTMDIFMPGLNGIDAVSEIIKKDEKAKIIMITGHGNKEIVIDVINKGAKDYLLKPITADKLKNSITKIFN